MLQPGIKAEKSRTVTDANTAKTMGSGTVGMTVTATTELVEVDRRRLVFHAEVYDEKGLVGKGTHERFLVENEKFQAKADAKNQ